MLAAAKAAKMKQLFKEAKAKEAVREFVQAEGISYEDLQQYLASDVEVRPVLTSLGISLDELKDFCCNKPQNGVCC